MMRFARKIFDVVLDIVLYAIVFVILLLFYGKNIFELIYKKMFGYFRKKIEIEKNPEEPEETEEIVEDMETINKLQFSILLASDNTKWKNFFKFNDKWHCRKCGAESETSSVTHNILDKAGAYDAYLRLIPYCPFCEGGYREAISDLPLKADFPAKEQSGPSF